MAETGTVVVHTKEEIQETKRKRRRWRRRWRITVTEDHAGCCHDIQKNEEENLNPMILRTILNGTMTSSLFRSATNTNTTTTQNCVVWRWRLLLLIVIVLHSYYSFVWKEDNSIQPPPPPPVTVSRPMRMMIQPCDAWTTSTWMMGPTLRRRQRPVLLRGMQHNRSKQTHISAAPSVWVQLPAAAAKSKRIATETSTTPPPPRSSSVVSSSSAASPGVQELWSDRLYQWLEEYQYHSRWTTLRVRHQDRNIMNVVEPSEPVYYAEVYHHGDAHVGRIVALEMTLSKEGSLLTLTHTPPKVVVELLDDNIDPPCLDREVCTPLHNHRNRSTVILDWGQVTTVFRSPPLLLPPPSPPQQPQQWLPKSHDPQQQDQKKKKRSPWAPKTEQALDALYRDRVGRGRKNTGSTKKQVATVVQRILSSSSSSSQSQSHDDDHDDDFNRPNNHNKNNNTTNYRNHTQVKLLLEDVVRHVLKTGTGCSRIVDAASLFLLQRRQQQQHPPNPSNDDHAHAKSQSVNNHKREQEEEMVLLRELYRASRDLARDAKTGGRFKRWPCVFVSYSSSSSSNSSCSFSSICFLNGGWLIADQSVRVEQEARKFVVEHGHHNHQHPPSNNGSSTRVLLLPSANTTTNLSSTIEASLSYLKTRGSYVKTSSSSSLSKPPTEVSWTPADVRIVQRLECFAMGEGQGHGDDGDVDVVDKQGNNPMIHTHHDRNRRMNIMVEHDVRNVLQSMHLPVSPNGARDALLNIGWWTTTITTNTNTNTTRRPTSSPDSAANVRRRRSHGRHCFRSVEPWSKEVLEATRWYAEQYQKNPSKGGLDTTHPAAKKKKAVKDRHRRSGGDCIDLTYYPSICIDARSTAFRDDALGIRPRSVTGRTVIADASKWEILIHVVDVSDIYFEDTISKDRTVRSDDDDGDLKNKVMSHYRSCLKNAARRRGSSRYDLPLGPLHLLPPRLLDVLSFSNKQRQIHRSVTLWAYIDERDGNLLECGVERTQIRSPTLMSYGEATQTMDQLRTSQSSNTQMNHEQAATRAMLWILERNIQLWSKRQKQQNDVAKRREYRFEQRERRSTESEMASFDYSYEDNSGKVFERSRGHRLVDSALDLYSFGITSLLSRVQAPIPQAKGADSSRGGRVATAPLRRYIDGESQRQALAVLCGYGRRLNAYECREIGRVANEARNSIANIRVLRKT